MAISKDLLDILACPKCKGPVQLTPAGDGLACNSCRLVSNIRRFWLASVLTCTCRYSPTRIICAMPRASLRSLLLSCADSAAFICRVSTQITGKPASANPL